MDVSEEAIEAEMKKIQEELFEKFDPIARECIAQYNECMSFLESGASLFTKETRPRSRPVRNAFKNATSKILNQACNINTKLRRPDSSDFSDNIYDHLHKKQEDMDNNKLQLLQPLQDLSNFSKRDSSIILLNYDIGKMQEVVISDDENQMPPPVTVPKKKRVRKIKSEKNSLSSLVKEEKVDNGVPVRKSNRLKSSIIVDKSLSVPTPKKSECPLNEQDKIASTEIENIECPPPAPLPSGHSQNDTSESVYEDAKDVTSQTIAINQADACENGYTTKLEMANGTILVQKSVKRDTKIFQAIVLVSKLKDSSQEKLENDKESEIEINEEILPGDILLDTNNATFVKSHNPRDTHVIGHEIDIEIPQKELSEQTTTAGVMNDTVIIDKNHGINETFAVPNEKSQIQKSDNQENITSPKEIHTTNFTNGSTEGSSLITDDDSDAELSIELKFKKEKRAVQDNILFSSQSPVKCRVKAFEKVIASEQQLPMRVTRTKSRAIKQNKSQDEASQIAVDTVNGLAMTVEANLQQNQNLSSHTSKLPTSIKKNSRTKINTPQTIPKSIKGITPLWKSQNSKMNTSNANSRIIATGLATFLPKTNSAVKTVNREEVHKKQQAKEEEAKRKKEQILLEKQEEHKRKRMEKERLVQQAREQQEKEKAMLLEKLAKEKEKKKKFLLEREEKIKEEMRLKKQLAAQKAQESEKRRKMEEQARIQRLQEQEEEQKRLEMQQKKEEEDAERLRLLRQAQDAAESERKRQAYAEHKAKQLKLQELQKNKLLETQNSCKQFDVPATAMKDGFENLGSDYSTDEEGSVDRPSKFVRPKWAAYENRKVMMANQAHTSSVLIDQLFRTTPVDLQEMFPQIAKEKLRRKSSAVWRTPPRYSLLQKY